MQSDPAPLRLGVLSITFPQGIELQVGRDPFSMGFLLDGRPVLVTDPEGALAFRRNGAELRSRSLLSWSMGDSDGTGCCSRAELCVATEAADCGLLVEIESTPSRILVSVRCSDGGTAEAIGVRFATSAGDHWFGADVLTATQWRLNAWPIRRDPFLPTGNQTAPLWLSSRGAAIFKLDHQPIGFSFTVGEAAREDGTFDLHGVDAARFGFCLCIAQDIRQAHRTAMSCIGVPKSAPPMAYFRKPVFSTWIEFLTSVRQQGITDYVDDMEASGFSCGVLVVDDKWMRHYGDLEFDPDKFPDPRKMVEALHSRDIRVALWTTPFLDEDSTRFAEARSRGYLLRRKGTSEPLFSKWWNGTSALVDLSNPDARAWFVGGLRALASSTGVDGFKLDAGDGEFLAQGYDSFAPMNPWEYADAFASIGAEFDVNELRVSWLTQKLGLVQRLRDKCPTWSPVDGLGSIIPHGLCEGLLGYPYFCADMIGGGWDVGFRDGQPMDEELFIRWTQASALLPIMQFSYAPWRLSEHAAAICRRYVQMHEQFSGYIYSLATAATRDGTPIVKPLFYDSPGDSVCYRVFDQFLLGERFLVAPVLTRGARRRPVYLPAGDWKDYWSGVIRSGPRLLEAYDADLEKLPLFERGA